ncbi:MAG TPA: helix-turn-helix transcriptional regulator [Chloroflexota bacterium]|nr:helix-turn-helix transcriptional regulator [Chloroflexota bacterium]
MDEFATLFQRWRERAGLSQNALARRMGVNPAYVNRLEHGGRGAGNRELVEAAATALSLSPAERDALLGAAGHWPDSLAELGPADPSLQLVASVLTDPGLSEQERALFRLQVRLAALAWRPPAADGRLADAAEQLGNLLR